MAQKQYNYMNLANSLFMLGNLQEQGQHNQQRQELDELRIANEEMRQAGLKSKQLFELTQRYDQPPAELAEEDKVRFSLIKSSSDRKLSELLALVEGNPEAQKAMQVGFQMQGMGASGTMQQQVLSRLPEPPEPQDFMMDDLQNAFGYAGLLRFMSPEEQDRFIKTSNFRSPATEESFRTMVKVLEFGDKMGEDKTKIPYLATRSVLQGKGNKQILGFLGQLLQSILKPQDQGGTWEDPMGSQGANVAQQAVDSPWPQFGAPAPTSQPAVQPAAQPALGPQPAQPAGPGIMGQLTGAASSLMGAAQSIMPRPGGLGPAPGFGGPMAGQGPADVTPPSTQGDFLGGVSQAADGDVAAAMSDTTIDQPQNKQEFYAKIVAFGKDTPASQAYYEKYKHLFGS